MPEPRPALVLLVLEGLGLGLLLGHWLALPPGQRQQQLWAVWQVEQAATPPPPTLRAQARWLGEHRRQYLYARGGLLVVALGIGLCEGQARRQRDPYGGVGFFHVALGQLLLAGTLGAVLGLLVLPWPLPPLAVTLGLAGLLGGTGFCLAAGRPSIR